MITRRLQISNGGLSHYRILIGLQFVADSSIIWKLTPLAAISNRGCMLVCRTKNGCWKTLASSNVAFQPSIDLPDGDRQRALVLHDSDTKFTKQFREILKAEGLRPKKLIPVSPNL